MIAATVETSLAVDTVEAFRSEPTVAAGCGAMYYDKVDTAAAVQAELWQTVCGDVAAGGGNGLRDYDWVRHEQRVYLRVEIAERTVRTANRRQLLSRPFAGVSALGRSGYSEFHQEHATVRDNPLSRLSGECWRMLGLCSGNRVQPVP